MGCYRMNIDDIIHDGYEGHELFKLGHQLGALAESIYGESAANAAMKALLHELLRQSGRSAAVASSPMADRVETDPWREVWEALDAEDSPVDASDFDLIETAQRCCDLYYYGLFGHLPMAEWSASEEVKAYIWRAIGWAGSLIENVPPQWIVPLQDLPRTFAAAQGRWKLDETREALTVEEVAALGDVTPKTIRNLLSKGELRRAGSVIPADAAEEWLQAAPGFKPSTWRNAGHSQKLAEEPSDALGQPVFVPHDADGRAFLPDVGSASGYTVGAKGSEAKVQDYWEALALLQEMETPRWRRPSMGSGRPSIVVAKGWRRISRSEIDRMLSE